MLSRVADCAYWMSRYLERAEHTARIGHVCRSVRLERSSDTVRRLMRAVSAPPSGYGPALPDADAISSDELRSAYSVLPCQYSGSISIAGTSYQFSINIGRFGFIRGASPQDVSLFGCEEACKELFQIVSDGT